MTASAYSSPALAGFQFAAPSRLAEGGISISRWGGLSRARCATTTSLSAAPHLVIASKLLGRAEGRATFASVTDQQLPENR
jgi:hypothetical protein